MHVAKAISSIFYTTYTVANLDSDDDPPAFTSGADRQSLCVRIERDINLAQLVQAHYHKDPLFMKVLHHLEAHPCFGIRDWLIWTKNQMGRDVVCIPRKAFIRGEAADQGHTRPSSHHNWPFWSIIYQTEPTVPSAKCCKH